MRIGRSARRRAMQVPSTAQCPGIVGLTPVAHATRHTVNCALDEPDVLPGGRLLKSTPGAVWMLRAAIGEARMPKMLAGTHAVVPRRRWDLPVGVAILVAFLAIMLAPADAALAVTRSWEGDGPDTNWSTGANWTGGIAPQD